MKGKVADSSKSLAERTYHILRKNILEMRIRPGEILLIQHLARELDVSRTPVREALARLRQEGLVEPASGSKMKVSSFTARDIWEIYEIREGLESMAAGLAASKASESQADELGAFYKIFKNIYEREDFDSFLKEDSRFHYLIIEIAGNDLMKKTIEGLDGRIQRIRYYTLATKESWFKYAYQCHLKIIDSILNRDKNGAYSAMKDHLLHAKQNAYSIFGEKGESLGLFYR